MTKTYTVIDAFSTPTRRFLPGTDKEPVEISIAELAGPLSIADWERLGKVKPIGAKAEKPKRAPAEPVAS